MRILLWGAIWGLMVGGWACEDADDASAADMGPDAYVETYCSGPGGGLTEGGPGVCCAGLVGTTAYVYEGQCSFEDPDFAVCIRCGDGICDTYENECSCPEDCAEECILERGQWRPDGELSCCGDLVPVGASRPTDDGMCTDPEYFVCGKCGDGVCVPAENECNCPEDCPAEAP